MGCRANHPPKDKSRVGSPRYRDTVSTKCCLEDSRIRESNRREYNRSNPAGPVAYIAPDAAKLFGLFARRTSLFDSVDYSLLDRRIKVDLEQHEIAPRE